MQEERKDYENEKQTEPMETDIESQENNVSEKER